jgi:hypothetical protein
MNAASNGGGSRLARVSLIAGLWLACVGDARAIPISPLFFNGAGGFGFSPASVSSLSVGAVATPDSPWLLAGARSLLDGPGLVVENHLSMIHANPQGAGQTPSGADPLIADSIWTVRNETGSAFAGGFLVFTAIDIDRRYPGLLAGLDGALLEIVEYSSGGTDYAFGAVALPSLGVGQSVDLTVRYVVAGPLDYDAETNSFTLPRLGIAGLVVPEPVAAGTLGLGLAVLAAWRRARSPSRSAPA